MTDKPIDLPSSDHEYWEGAKTTQYAPKQIPLCDTHDYVSDNNGYATCTQCPYGVRLPGYMKVREGKIIDLRNSSGG